MKSFQPKISKSLASPVRWRPFVVIVQFVVILILAGLLTLAESPNQTNERADEPKHSIEPLERSDGLKQDNQLLKGGQNDVKQHQQQAVKHMIKCTRQSIMLARQMIVHELNHINNYNQMWFSESDKNELIEHQKHSLSNIVMSGHGTRLLHPDGQPLIEIESSYFRAHTTHQKTQNHHYYNATNSHKQQQQQQPLAIKLIRRHQDRCYLNSEKSLFTYVLGLSIGPIEHHLDVVYNLPKDLSLSQPIDWRYGQITIQVPKMIYEVTLKQMADYKLNSLSPFPSSQCPSEIGEVIYLPPNSYTTNNANKPQVTIASSGLALNNQTILQIERLFDDYTRPIISRRLRQMLRFYLNTKTLPLTSG